VSKGQVREGDHVKHLDPKINENLKMLVIRKERIQSMKWNFFAITSPRVRLKKDWFGENVTLFVDDKKGPHS
jgi:hypothetical protein